MSPVIDMADVSFRYDGPAILENINLSVARGEFLGLVGPNGGGKTTLMKLMLGLLPPTRGTVRVLGEKPSDTRTQVGYVPQFASFRRDFPISVEETVLMGRLGVTSPLGSYRKPDREAAIRTMCETGVIALRKRPLSALSGGQLQKVLIARALVSSPELLLLDEPTANIDLRGDTEVFDLLVQINDRATIVVVSHDIGFISRYVGRMACLNRTLICHSTSEVSGEVIQALYGQPVKLMQHSVPGELVAPDA